MQTENNNFKMVRQTGVNLFDSPPFKNTVDVLSYGVFVYLGKNREN
uniref:Uncharacterized protein n=1 Tax=uncultured Bacillota bacterium TaxID=344338 RepID=A0A650ENY7_9FIRM|nr:hypothetical protein Firmicute1046_1170 [uncultured Firmicutes bacterium]